MDISIDIIDTRVKVPGTDSYMWDYREKHPDWEPGPDYPRVKPEALPVRRFDVTEYINATFKAPTERERQKGDFESLPTADYVIQHLARKEALDLRQWGQQYDYKLNAHTGPEVPFGKIKAASLFLDTVHNCFARHYPLGIRPEALMYMVLHEIGICVKQNPEDYRDLFTTSADKQLISVQVNELDIDDPESPWYLGVERIRAVLNEKVPPGIMQHCLPGFSTDNLESTTAAIIAFMDAASPFYNYMMRTCCGIPKIRLFGEADDYKRILVACGQLSERFQKHLGKYFKYLLPVLEKIHAQVSGAEPIDQDFWSSIYNHYSGSGTDDMDGWITAFVCYENHGGRYVQKSDEMFDWKTNLTENQKPGVWGSGIHRDVIPMHVSSVPFLWQYSKNHAHRAYKSEGGVVFDCRLVSGFLGIEDIDGYATPMLSYAVLRGDELKQERKGEGADQDVTVQREGGEAVTFKRGNLFGVMDNRKYNS